MNDDEPFDAELALETLVDLIRAGEFDAAWMIFQELKNNHNGSKEAATDAWDSTQLPDVGLED